MVDEAWHLAARVAALVCCALAVVAPPFASGKDRPAKQLYGVIAGTVFRDSGMTLRGAQVTVAPEPGSASARKRKKLSALTDGRGEFAVRVPAVAEEPGAALRYTVRVEAPGFKPQTNSVSVSGDERVDLFFQLEPAQR